MVHRPCACRDREQTLRALRHEEVDRLPFDSIGSTSSRPVARIVEEMGLSQDERSYYLDGAFRYLRFGSRADPERFREYLEGAPADAVISDWGVADVAVQSVEGYHAGHNTCHPLARVDTLAELERYPFPDMTEAWRHADLERQVLKAKEAGFVVVGQMSQTILETAYEMRGLEQLLLDFYERPEYVEALFERIGDVRRFQARRFAEAGVDVLRIGDDIATQQSLLVGLKMYRERIKPFHASTIAAARAVNPAIQVLYHSDGNLVELLPDLIEVGVTAINPVQPECMDLPEVKRRFGSALVLWGCCGSQTVYAGGSRADVDAHVRLLRGPLSAGGGLVVQFYNMLLTPEALQSLRAFFETFGAGRLV